MWALRRALIVAHSNKIQPKNNILQTSKKVHSVLNFSSTQTDGELKLTQILNDKLSPNFLQVNDISGGCGAMYRITIGSKLFEGKRTIEQHKMVNEALGDEIKSLHGLTIQIHNPNDQ